VRARLSRLPLTPVFGIFSLVAMVVVALALQTSLRSMIEERALADAVRGSDFVTQVALEPILGPALIRGELTERERLRVDAAVDSGIRDGVLARMKVFDRDGRVLYSDDRSVVGQRYDLSPELRAVLAGGPSTHELADTADAIHAGERGMGALMEVFVAVHRPGTSDAVGLAELYVPQEPVQDSVAQDTRTLLTILVVGLALLWLLLVWLVSASSRRLRRQLARNSHQARHDALTDLPNREVLFERTDRALAFAGRRGASVAVLLIDLDRFKEVNDTLGHHNGDRLLVEVAARFARVLGPTHTLARLGGDEFAVLLPEVAGEAAADVVADDLLAALERPVDLDGLTVSVGGSIGIALAPRDGDSADVLLQRADVAMYTAKESRGPVAHYRLGDDRYSRERLGLLGEMRGALKSGQLALYFQPKAEVGSGRISGMEALLRWEHPQRGLLLPGEFIPVVEHTGLIDVVTPYVVERALVQCGTWAAAGHDLRVSVNVSVRNITDRAFPGRVARLLTASPVPADRLVLEITESALMTEPETGLEVIRELKALGVGLSIDDYGSGYSSLAYLQGLPVDELKIDRQFVQHLATRRTDRAIVRSTIELGQSLGLLVVAEGVEDASTWNVLADLECDLVQGYHLGRPMPADEVVAWMSRRSVRTTAPAATR
jgi:diguanylate cyclase